MKEIHRTDKKTKEIIHNLAIAKHVNKIQAERVLLPKIKRTSVLLSVLLILDVISTLVLLNLVPAAYEVNPLLNYFSNVELSVVLSHIFAIGVIYFMFSRLKKDTYESKRNGLLGLRITTFFYLIVVISNTSQLIYWSLFL
jgi:hypothetical protein